MICCCCGADMRDIGVVNEYRCWDCPACGCQRFLNENISVVSSSYEDDTDYSADIAVAKRYSNLIQWNHRVAWRSIRRLSNKTTVRILDLGAFTGFFVRYLVDRGVDAYGIDFNGQAVAFGRANYELDGRLFEGGVGDMDAVGSDFDVVTAFEVIEHLEDPGAFVTMAAELLPAGGLLVLSTPNGRMVWRPPLDEPPHHLSRFTPKSIDQLLENHGFEVVEHYEQMSLFYLLRHRVGLLFRNRETPSMRGGSMRRGRLVNLLKAAANRFRRVAEIASAPLDLVARSVGWRYIFQVVVARKIG